ncbi:MAG TPA: M48 family metalloprotease, partial [Candidatus Woesebacteria bacterium]|nr:M48 family metalloprotease [Candidatus Woesebacteria bacterium]
MTHYQLVAANKRRSFYVVFFFMVFIGLAAYLMSYVFELSPSFIGTALIAAGAMSFGSYWFSDKIILSMSGAKPVTRQEYFDFYTVAENLASSQRMPLPKLYVINDSAMNAFATGRDYNHAVVVATSGLLSRLNRSEIEGVIAHELSHIKNYDMLLMSIVAILVGFIALLSDWM